MSLDAILASVKQNKQLVGTDDSTRSLTTSSLIAGVVPTEQPSPLNQTIRISSAGDQGFATGENQSDRGQIPPSTLNKVPRIYGNVTTGGVIIDATKIDANTLMYAFAISEMDRDRYDLYDKSGTSWDPSFILSSVYRDNSVAEFSVTSGNKDQVIKLTSLVDGSNVDISAGNTRVWAWAGNTASTSQIFPDNRPNLATYNVNAYDVFPTWDANITCEGLCIAIVKVTFDDPNDIKDFGSWKFTVESQGYIDESEPTSTYRDLRNPAWALQDYLTSERYGLGLTLSDLDQTSFADWAAYCEENQYYASDVLAAGGSGATFPDSSSGYVNPHDRFRIDGFINTQQPLLQNIERICAAGMATLNYDHKTGLFKILFSKQMTNTDQTTAFHFTSDNIVGSITVNTSDIFSMFDFAQSTFPNYQQQDDRDTIIVSVPSADRFINEISATTNFNLDCVSDRPRAARIANISLKQSRVGTIVNLTGDHSTMTVDVGDFVKVSDELKGWTEKYFRVIRIRETENVGVITCAFTLQEYTSTPYEEIIYYDTVDDPFATGFGTSLNWDDPDVANLSFYNKYTTFVPDVQTGIYDGLYVFDDPVTEVGKSINTDTGVITNASVPIGSAPISIQNSPDLANESWLVIHTGLNVAGSDPEFSNLLITVNDTVSTDYLSSTTSHFQSFAPQSVSTYTGFPIDKLKSTGTYNFTVQYQRSVIDPDAVSPELLTPPQFSTTYTSANFTVSDDSVTGNAMIDTVGKNSQIVDSLPDTVYSFATTGTTRVLAELKHDVIDAAPGIWDFAISFTQGYDDGAYGGGEYLNLSPRLIVKFVNTENILSETITVNAPGVNYDAAQVADSANVIGVVNSSTTSFNLDPGFYGLDTTWYPSRATVQMMMKANSLTNVSISDVDYTITNRNPYYRSS